MLSTSRHRQGHAVTDLLGVEILCELIDGRDGVAVDRGDDVIAGIRLAATLESRLRRRAAGHATDPQHPGVLAPAELARRQGGQRLAGDAEPGMLNGDTLLE